MAGEILWSEDLRHEIASVTVYVDILDILEARLAHNISRQLVESRLRDTYLCPLARREDRVLGVA